MVKLRFASIFIFPVIGLIISLVTLKDYGVNWDSFQHLSRGQIYLHYLTTGEKKENTSEAKSFYKNSSLDFAWTEKMTIGHPPLTDILLASSNTLFFQTLGWLGDIAGYHIFIVLITFFMSLIVAIWAYQTYGLFSSIVSVISLYTYPLLFAEQHFNLKDPAVAFYFTACLYFLWLGISKKKVFSVLIGAIFAGISLGTKFNIFFAIPIVFIWLVFYVFSQIKIKTEVSIRAIYKKVFSFRLIIALISVPIIAFALFYFSYPALWTAPYQKIVSVFHYYQVIGGSRCLYRPLTAQWLYLCSDFHTIRLFITSLPIITLTLSLIGLLLGVTNLKKFSLPTFLWACWLIVTIGRATLPISPLYGGSLRQIMEFIPAAALLSGVGALFIRNKLIGWLPIQYRRKTYISISISCCIVFSFIPVIISMIQVHPNENVYQNEIVGGLKGAVHNGYPLATNTYGNGYKQVIDWVNRNAPFGSIVYLVDGIGSAVPSIVFRSDIAYKGTAPFIIHHDGAYLIELSEPGMDISKFHNTRFVRTFLQPIQEIVVDGVVLASIWKNDQTYIKTIQSFDEENEVGIDKIIPIGNDEVIVDLGKPIMVKKIILQAFNDECNQSIEGLFSLVSTDGINYKKILEDSHRFSGFSTDEKNNMVYIYLGLDARYIRLYSYKNTTCNLSSQHFQVFSY